MAWPNQSPPGSNPSSTPEFTPPAIVALASGIIMFLASILPWLKSDFADTGFSAWTTDISLFPVATFVPLAGLVTAGLVAARLFMKDKVPSDILSFTPLQIQIALAFFTLLLALGYLVMDKSGIGDLGFGYWLNLLGAIGLMVAAVMEYMAAKNPSAGYAGGPSSYGPPPQQHQPQQQQPQQGFPPPGAQQYPQQPQPGHQPYPPQQQPPRPQPQPQQQRPQQPPPGQGYPPPPPQQGGNWPQQ